MSGDGRTVWTLDLPVRPRIRTTPSFHTILFATGVKYMSTWRWEARFPMVREWTPIGLHQFVGESLILRYAKPGLKAIDLGSGGGAMADRMHSLGCEVVSADLSAKGYEAKLAHITIDLNQPDF